MSSCPLSYTELEVDSDAFPPSVNSPASSKPLFLGGAGEKGLDIQGRFQICNVVRVYLDSDAVPSLSVKWKGKTAEELTESDPFYHEIITGPFEKFIKVFNKLPFPGQRYSETVKKICVPYWKSLGIYTDAEAKAVEKFLEVFKNHITFPPGSSVFFAISSNGSSLTVAFSNDHSIPETGFAVIDNKLLAEAVFASFVVGKSGLPARLSPAKRLFQLMNMENKVEEDATRTDLEDKLAKEKILEDNLAKEKILREIFGDF